MSPEISVDITVSPSLKARLTKLAALNSSPEMEKAKRQIAVLALQDQQREFHERSAGEGARATIWPPLSDITVIMRKAGAFGRIYGEEDVAAKRATIAPLRDSNRMFASLQPNAPGNIMEVAKDSVRVGSGVAYGPTHQKGGSATFKFGPEEEKRFDQNVSATKRGMKKPERLSRFATHVWKGTKRGSPWNTFYFKTKGALRKMAGKTYHVVARPFIHRPTTEESTKYRDVVSAAVKRITG